MKTMKEIIEQENQEILAGKRYTVPGETERARREAFYCSNLDCKCCGDCPLVNYGRDCHNNELDCKYGISSDSNDIDALIV